MEIDPKLIKSSFISNKIKELLDEKDMTITEISEKIGASRPSISNILNGKVVGSDNIFKKLLKALGLTEKEITEIFKQADIETFKYKYGVDEDDFKCGKKEIEIFENSLEVALKKEFGMEVDKETLDKIREFINFIKSTKK